MRYEIFEGNMERLQKKLKRIENKCRKYGCEFRFEIVGETFRTLFDDNREKYTARFVVVEAEGKAVMNDWQFVAAVEHTPKGNLFSGVSGIEIPERYYTSDPVCEHCGTSHKRKYTYIVMNTVTGDFKQVGKSCLGDFTHGLDAGAAALYISYFDTLIAGEAPYEGGTHTRYIEVEKALKYVAETIRAFGYVRAQDTGVSTMRRAFRYYALDQGWRGMFNGKEEKRYRAEMESVSFNPDSPEIARQVVDALKWVEGQEDKNNYLHNLKTVCSLSYVTGKHFGLLASLFPAYNKDLEYQAEKAEQQRKAAKELEGKMGSRHIGNIKDRITVQVDSFRCVTSWEGDFGITRLYEIMDDAGNVFTWKTGKILEEGISSIVGTVKAHTEFRGVHQTELTRCRVAA